MSDPRHTSSTHFVIQGLDSEAAHRLARSTGDVIECAPLDDARSLTQVTLAEAPSGDGRRAWQRVRDQVAKSCNVLPALQDEDGTIQFPTGNIQVRFSADPSEEALHDFAREHRLELVERNPYQPLQAMFAISAGETDYLPDLLDRLQSDPRIYRAWPEVLDRPKRYP